MNELIADNKQAIFNLCEQNHVKSLYLFGSVNDALRFNEKSDIDIFVSFEMEGLTLEKYTDSYFNLVFGLEELLQRKIDITTEISVTNPFFKEELDRTKKLLFDSAIEVNGY